jgi:hypothetical protein
MRMNSSAVESTCAARKIPSLPPLPWEWKSNDREAVEQRHGQRGAEDGRPPPAPAWPAEGAAVPTFARPAEVFLRPAAAPRADAAPTPTPAAARRAGAAPPGRSGAWPAPRPRPQEHGRREALPPPTSVAPSGSASRRPCS